MRNLFKELLVTGLGTLVVTKEKAEEIVEKLVKQGEITRKEGQELLDEFLEKTEEGTSELSDRIYQKIKERLQEAGFVTSEETDQLRQQIQQLQKEVAELREKGVEE